VLPLEELEAGSEVEVMVERGRSDVKVDVPITITVQQGEKSAVVFPVLKSYAFIRSQGLCPPLPCGPSHVSLLPRLLLHRLPTT
jgi:hypothetical protein